MYATFDEIKTALEAYNSNESNIFITDSIEYEVNGQNFMLIHCEDEAENQFAAIAYPEGEIAVMSDWQTGSRPVFSDEIADYDWVGVNY